jgi:hypothetical protein
MAVDPSGHCGEEVAASILSSFAAANTSLGKETPEKVSDAAQASARSNERSMCGKVDDCRILELRKGLREVITISRMNRHNDCP